MSIVQPYFKVLTDEDLCDIEEETLQLRKNKIKEVEIQLDKMLKSYNQIESLIEEDEIKLVQTQNNIKNTLTSVNEGEKELNEGYFYLFNNRKISIGAITGATIGLLVPPFGISSITTIASCAIVGAFSGYLYPNELRTK